jgi:membrane-bound serine protease (ClpP class)
MIQRVPGFATLVGMVAAIGLVASAYAQQPLVDKFILSDTIQPVTQGELDRAIAHANSDGASALLIELNTPGGLLDSTRTMAGAILSSKVPVIVYVAPAGARAGSAGFFLLESADIAAMSPSTNAGAAHPVMEFGGQPDATMSQKIENDAEAAEDAVHTSHSYTAQEALDKHLIDLTASNDWELLRALDGREITRMDGNKLVLHLANPRIETLKPTMREALLGWLVDPNIALLFLIGGALLIYLEFNTPGTIVPGALGTLMVLLAIFALKLLPIRFTAILLLVAALILLLLEAKFGGHGVLATAGIICLTFGTLTLVAAPVPEMAISPWVAIAVSAAFGSITVFLVRLAVRARRRKSIIGPSALVGSRASAMEPLTPGGHVLVEGEIWSAVASQPVPAGAPLRVVGLENYLLRVEPAAPQKPPQALA